MADRMAPIHRVQIKCHYIFASNFAFPGATYINSVKALERTQSIVLTSTRENGTGRDGTGRGCLYVGSPTLDAKRLCL